MILERAKNLLGDWLEVLRRWIFNLHQLVKTNKKNMAFHQRQIADWAIRIGRISMEIGRQLHGAKVEGYSKFLLGLSSRHAIILQDIHFILRDNPASQLTSCFILFRSLMDDFLTLLYFEAGNFNPEDLNKHAAESEKHWFKMYDQSREINEEHFGYANPDLATQQFVDQQKANFAALPGNDILFEDKAQFKFKKFPTTADQVKEMVKRYLDETGKSDEQKQTDKKIAKANVHAYVIWMLLSKYVHYSYRSYQLETSKETRQTEIEQMGEILMYCFKAVHIISHRLNQMGFAHKFNDASNVYGEIFKGAQEA